MQQAHHNGGRSVCQRPSFLFFRISIIILVRRVCRGSRRTGLERLECSVGACKKKKKSFFATLPLPLPFLNLWNGLGDVWRGLTRRSEARRRVACFRGQRWSRSKKWPCPALLCLSVFLQSRRAPQRERDTRIARSALRFIVQVDE